MQLHLLPQMTGSDHSTMRCASIWVFQLMLVVLHPPSCILTSHQATEHPPQEWYCLCSLLLTAQAECKRTWWGKRPLFHSASHKLPIKLPVSKHSPTPSSFHTIYSMHTRNTNWTKPCQSRFLSKGLCKQNQMAIIMYVVHHAKLLLPLLKWLCFSYDQPHLHPYNSFIQVRGRRCCSAPVYPPENTALTQCCTIKAIWWLCIFCNQHPITTTAWQLQAGQCERWLLWHNPSLCQPVLL